MHTTTRIAMLSLILVTGVIRDPAHGMKLLEVVAGMPVVPGASAAGPDAFTVTMLARVIAAEAGGDYFSSLVAKKAVGGAMVNEVRRRFGVPKIEAAHIQRVLREQPGFLSSWRDGNHHLYARDAAWLQGHGYAGCLAAARAALAGEDASRGATNWYDGSIGQPYSSSRIVVTGRVKTAGKGIVFYRFR